MQPPAPQRNNERFSEPGSSQLAAIASAIAALAQAPACRLSQQPCKPSRCATAAPRHAVLRSGSAEACSAVASFQGNPSRFRVGRIHPHICPPLQSFQPLASTCMRVQPALQARALRGAALELQCQSGSGCRRSMNKHHLVPTRTKRLQRPCPCEPTYWLTQQHCRPW